jgi:hypothetical protein
MYGEKRNTYWLKRRCKSKKKKKSKAIPITGCGGL